MALLTRSALAALLVAALGCDIIPPPTEPEQTGWQLQVHAVLLAGADSATVLLTRVRGSGDGSGIRREAVAGASVRLSGGGVVAELTAGAAGAACGGGFPGSPPDSSLSAGCYAARIAGGVRAGEPYELRIDLPDGESVLGRTVVPPVPPLLSPGPGVTIRVPRYGSSSPEDPVALDWLAAPGSRVEAAVNPAPGCEAWISAEGSSYGTYSVVLTAAPPADLRVNGLFCRGPVPPGEYPAELVLTVFDSTYTRYARETLGVDQLPAERAAAGITGAVGVFASAAQARIPVSLAVK
ncbi:MAG TPA: hypothetical protein VFQ38_13790 [Longimicrobiales bacterium]|nr:hypothetical protein [Longimicrobiales bacterium]